MRKKTMDQKIAPVAEAATMSRRTRNSYRVRPIVRTGRCDSAIWKVQTFPKLDGDFRPVRHMLPPSGYHIGAERIPP